MLELVCYVAIDDIYKGEKSYVYKNIDEDCLSQRSNLLGGDGPIEEKSGLVVGVNPYSKLIYKTHIEKLKPGQYSECDGPDEIREIFHYYETSEEIIKSCKNNEYEITIGKIIDGALAFDSINPETFDTDELALLTMLGVKTSAASSLSGEFTAVSEAAYVSEDGFISSDIISYYNTWYLLPIFTIGPIVIGYALNTYYHMPTDISAGTSHPVTTASVETVHLVEARYTDKTDLIFAGSAINLGPYVEET